MLTLVAWLIVGCAALVLVRWRRAPKPLSHWELKAACRAWVARELPLAYDEPESRCALERSELEGRDLLDRLEQEAPGDGGYYRDRRAWLLREAKRARKRARRDSDHYYTSLEAESMASVLTWLADLPLPVPPPALNALYWEWLLDQAGIPLTGPGSSGDHLYAAFEGWHPPPPRGEVDFSRGIL